jgi:hypothetical protein
MPQLQNRKNAFMEVQEPKPEPQIEKSSITEQEDEMFIKPPPKEEPEKDIKEVIIEQPEKQVKKAKKPCSDKLKAHLAKCRETSLAKRRAKAKNKEPVKRHETENPLQSNNETLKPIVPEKTNNNFTLDYDKIINGVTNSLYSKFGLDEPDIPPPTPQPQPNYPAQPKPQPSYNHPNQAQLNYQQSRFEQPTINKQMLLEYEKKIRQDERERVKRERQIELDKTYKSKGMNVLKNNIPTHRKHDIQPRNTDNPFFNAFGRR